MPHLEAILAYCRDPMGRLATSVPIGRTSDPGLLSALRDRLIAEAEGEARMWQDVDPALAEMAAAEVDRLERVLELLLPVEAGLQLVEDEE